MENCENKIINLSSYPEHFERASQWFCQKWGVPQKAYYESMVQSTGADNAVPQWFIALSKNDEIVAGAGVIENDFHRRKDLSPNICALYVEKEYRGKGLARSLLGCACKALKEKGFEKVYLITSHTDFYERCGWEFYSIIEEDNGSPIRMYCHILN